MKKGAESRNHQTFAEIQRELANQENTAVNSEQHTPNASRRSSRGRHTIFTFVDCTRDQVYVRDQRLARRQAGLSEVVVLPTVPRIPGGMLLSH